MKMRATKYSIIGILLFMLSFVVVVGQDHFAPPGTPEDNAQVDIIITVEGTAEGLLKTAMGVPALKPEKGVSDGGKLGRECARLLASDLDFSSYFNIVGVPELPPLPEGGYSELTLDLTPYAERGAELLVAGTYSIDSQGNYIFDMRLIDVTLKSLLGKVVYKGGKEQYRRFMHRFADEVLRIMTGERGPFDTRIIFVAEQTGNRELYMCDSDGYNLVQITNNKSINISPTWSPDGKYIAHTSYVLGNPDIYILPIEGGKPKRITSGRGLNYGADWSWANNRIAFASSDNPTNNQEIYTIKPDGTDLRQVTHDPWSIDVSPTWSPDGKYIAFVSNRYGDKPQVLVIPANGGTAKRISRTGGYNTDPTWSPIGWSEQEYLVAYCGRAGGGLDILAVRLDFSLEVLQSIGVITMPGADETPSFSPDGRFVVYSRGAQKNYDIYMASLREAKPRRITSLPGKEISPAWSPFRKD